MFVFKIWWNYLCKVKSNIYMDHKSLKYFFTQKEFNKRQIWWLELVKDYECEIKYHPGKANVVVYALNIKVVLAPIIAHYKFQQELVRKLIEVITK